MNSKIETRWFYYLKRGRINDVAFVVILFLSQISVLSIRTFAISYTSNYIYGYMSLKKYVIIVAGGAGSRMRSHVPKQFMLLGGIPVLMHTINTFYKFSSKIQIIVVLPEAEITTWKTLCSKYSFTVPHIIQEGGNSRFQSVKNGLEKIEGDGLVAIHDGVRPLVSQEVIKNSFETAAKEKSAVTAVIMKESIRFVEDKDSKAMDRRNYRLIQTPQTFAVALLKKAYDVEESLVFTDDASVVEAAGCYITLIEGNYENIKITTPEDLVIAACLLKMRQ